MPASCVTSPNLSKFSPCYWEDHVHSFVYLERAVTWGYCYRTTTAQQSTRPRPTNGPMMNEICQGTRGRKCELTWRLGEMLKWWLLKRKLGSTDEVLPQMGNIWEYHSIPTLCHYIWLVVSTMVSSFNHVSTTRQLHQPWMGPPEIRLFKISFPLWKMAREACSGVHPPLWWLLAIIDMLNF